MRIKPTFTSWNCAQQRVFLRADLNVPLVNGTITSDFRLCALQPTLNYLLEHETQVIIGCHIGRPVGTPAALSTKLLMPWFEKKGYSIQFAPTPQSVRSLPFRANTIILLENLRFFPGEKDKSTTFADELAQTAPWYVNDAAGSLHRDDTSLILLAQRYPKTHRSIGFLVQKELDILTQLTQHPADPVTFILGGGKVADKLPFIEHLFTLADTIVLCPAIVFTFLAAMGKPVGKSLVDSHVLAQIPLILKKGAAATTNFVFPHDYQIDKNGALSFVTAENFPSDGIGISIGPKTIDEIKKIITQSGTVFYNGMMGFPERHDTLSGTEAILRAMSESSATTIVAGGDSIAIVDQEALSGITHCITGGGSTLAYLSHQPLPGLQPFLENGTKPN